MRLWLWRWLLWDKVEGRLAVLLRRIPLFLVVFDACLNFLLVIVVFLFHKFLIFFSSIVMSSCRWRIAVVYRVVGFFFDFVAHFFRYHDFRRLLGLRGGVGCFFRDGGVCGRCTLGALWVLPSSRCSLFRIFSGWTVYSPSRVPSGIAVICVSSFLFTIDIFIVSR